MPQSEDESPSAWRNIDFRRLWLSNAVSKLGSAVTQTALPLTAVLVLDATPAQMALIVFAGQLPDLLFGLIAGVWIDRVRRLPVMVWSDLGRFVLLASIPLAAAIGRLSFVQLWLVAFLSGVLTLTFTIASVAILPVIVRSNQLVDANSKLAMTEAGVSLSGQGVGGVLVQLVTAPIAMLADAVSFLLSALFLRNLDAGDAGTDKRDRKNVRTEVVEGLKEVFRTPLLRALAISTGFGALAVAVQSTVFMLYLARTLALAPALVGIVVACWSAGGLLGSALAARAMNILGLGKAIVIGSLIFNLAGFLTPLASITSQPLQLGLLVAGQALSAAGFATYQVNQLSLRQAITPPHLLGRVTSARRFIVYCMAPLGALLGGVLGEAVGTTRTLVLAAALSLVGTAWLLMSPVLALRQPEDAHADPENRPAD